MTNTARGFASLGLILIIVIGLVVLGGGGWYVSKQSVAPLQPIDATASTTPPEVSQPSIPEKKQSGAIAASISIQGLDWSTSGRLPQVLYTVSGLPAMNVSIGLVSKATGKTIWSMEDVQSSLHSGTGALNLNTLDKFGTLVSVAPGDYLFRLSDFHSGALVAESASFTIPTGGGR